MPPKSTFVRIGDFFFKYRNVVFPVMWCVLFLAFAPAAGYASPLVIVGGLLVLAGLIVRGAVIGYAYIKRGGLNKQVYADTLVTEGFFNACRNPLYVGNMLIYTGIFVVHGNPVVMAVGTLGSLFIYQSIIAAEEYFLRNKFGASYDAYCADVPRWSMKLGRLRQATSEMSFNIKRVLVKDYSTIANALVTLTFLDGLRHYYYESPDMVGQSISLHVLVVIGILMVAVGISRAKKMKLLTA